MFSLIFFNVETFLLTHGLPWEGEKIGSDFGGLGGAHGGSLSALSIALQFISIFLEFLCKALGLISRLGQALGEEMELPGSLGLQTSVVWAAGPCLSPYI